LKAYDNTPSADDTFSNPVPHYVERYKLSAAPFSNQHEDRFVYLDAERLQRLNMLEHLTRYSELLLIITAAKGLGKTSLLQHFQLNTDEDTLVSKVDASPMMDADKLLQAIASGFDLANQHTDPASLQDALYHHLANLHHQGKIPVLVIDDAHVLPQDALETLFNLADAEASDGSLLRIILFSDPQIETMLQSPAIQGLRERVTHSMVIPAFDEEQTVGYLRHRLNSVGLQGALPFNDKELHKIFRNSGGIPARINECAHLILNGDKLDQAVKDFHTPRLKLRPFFKIPSLKLPAPFTKLKRWQLATILIAVLSISLILAYQDNINALFEADTTQTTTQLAINIPPPIIEPIAEASEAVIPLEAPTAKAEPITPSQTAEIKPEKKIVTLPVPLKDKTNITNVAAPITRDEAPTQASVESAPSSELMPTVKPVPVAKPAAKPAAPVITDISPNPVKTSRKAQTIAILGEHFNKKMKITVFWTGSKKTLSTKQIKIISADEMELLITVGRKADDWKVRLDDPISKQQTEARFSVIAATTTSPQVISKTANKTPTSTTLNTENWISQQTPKHFTLQLLGSHNKTSLQAFINKHELQQDIATFTSLRNQRPWHVLIQGRYISRADAEKAANSMRKNISGIKPWIRPFADIQKILKQQLITAPPVSIGKAPSPPPGTDVTTNAAWLWSQDPSYYTLQLLGGQTESGIKHFIQQHQLSGKAVYYRTPLNYAKPSPGLAASPVFMLNSNNLVIIQKASLSY